MTWRTLFVIFGLSLPVLGFGGDRMDDLVAQCRVTHFCNSMSSVPVGTSGKALRRLNRCFRDKVRSCLLATVLAGVRVGARSDQLYRTILYGRFCGWRNLSRRADGNAPDWKNLSDVVAAIRNTPAIDAIDEECKQHDLRYDEEPFSICESDTELTEKLQSLSWNPDVDLSPAAREVALAFSETIRQNQFSCGATGIIQRAKR